MISSKSFQELTYADKIACLKEIFGQITKQDPNLENIKYFLDTDFVFQDETLVNLFQMIEQGISEGKQLDTDHLKNYIQDMKTKAKQRQQQDSNSADRLLQGHDNTTNIGNQDAKNELPKEDINKKAGPNGQLNTEEIKSLNNKDSIYFKSLLSIIFGGFPVRATTDEKREVLEEIWIEYGDGTKSGFIEDLNDDQLGVLYKLIATKYDNDRGAIRDQINADINRSRNKILDIKKQSLNIFNKFLEKKGEDEDNKRLANLESQL